MKFHAITHGDRLEVARVAAENFVIRGANFLRVGGIDLAGLDVAEKGEAGVGKFGLGVIVYLIDDHIVLRAERIPRLLPRAAGS